MMSNILECRPPPRVYTIYLKEGFLTFKMSSVLSDWDHSLETAQEFYQVYQGSPDVIRNLLCEFYLHNYVVPHDKEWNPLLYIGDIHLRELMS